MRAGKARRLFLEFTTIVVGVLVALGVDAWYDQSRDRQRAAEYLSRIDQELARVRDLIDLRRRVVFRNVEAARLAAPFFDGPPLVVDHITVVVNLYNMGRDSPLTFETSTYQDLVATGSLGLIRDADLREAIQNAYQRVAEMESLRWPYRDEYLLGVRGWIPQQVIEHIRNACPNIGAIEWGTCDPNLEQFDLEPIVARLSSEEAILAFRLREQGLTSQLDVIDRAREAVETAMALLVQ